MFLIGIDYFKGYIWADQQVEMGRVYGDKFSSFHVIVNKIHFGTIISMSDFYETHKAMLPDDILRKLIIVSILVPDLFVYQNLLKKVKKRICK